MRVLTGITTLVCCVLMIGAVAISADVPQGQGSRTPQNLQVLPADTPMADVTAMMQNIRRALGVQCNHCHSGGPADRAKDDLPTKTVARNMMRMVSMLNQNMGGTAEAPKVTCYTCHRGSTTPATAPEGGGLLFEVAGN